MEHRDWNSLKGGSKDIKGEEAEEAENTWQRTVRVEDGEDKYLGRVFCSDSSQSQRGPASLLLQVAKGCHSPKKI